jgi:hypothetical protein
MNRTYLINGEHQIPWLFVWFLKSVVISLTAITLMGVAVWLIWREPDHNFLDGLPGFVSILLGVWGVYTGAGAMALWIALWIYWARIERSSARVGWFLTLLNGMHYGALIYAIYLWMTGRIKSATSHKILSSAQ